MKGLWQSLTHECQESTPADYLFSTPRWRRCNARREGDRDDIESDPMDWCHCGLRNVVECARACGGHHQWSSPRCGSPNRRLDGDLVVCERRRAEAARPGSNG